MDINQILELAKAIGELGILVIIASIAIYMVYQNWKIKQNKDSSDEESYKKLISDIQEQNNNLLQKILDVTSPKNITPEQFTEHSKASQKISEALEKARINNDASRCALVQFHNGGHNLLNNSFLKMDMTNERVKLGVALMQSEFKDQYKDLFSYWCHQLDKDGYCYIANVEDIKELDTSMYNFLSSRHIVSTYGISINDPDGYLIGYISLDFMIGDKQDFSKIKSCLQDKKIKIETLMSIK